MNLREFYKGKKVLITGNTGFKGSWMQLILEDMGAQVFGVALKPQKEENLFSILGLDKRPGTYYTDVRDLSALKKVFDENGFEIVIHMAAQPLVIESYKDPVGTYSVNVMGTVNVCECVRACKTVRSFVNVTTDKVYRNIESDYSYVESDVLDGYDPYSNSKSCSELVTACYKRSFLADAGIATSTCRAGNVIGGGDFADNRIVPDCFRSAVSSSDVIVRNPNSIRPYQHVLEAVIFYLRLAMLQYEDASFAGEYNIGPNDGDCLTTSRLCDMFCEKWGEGLKWEAVDKNGPHEAGFLKLDSSHAKEKTGWSPVWNAETAVEKAVEWYKNYSKDQDMREFSLGQIREYLSEAEKVFRAPEVVKIP